MRILHTSDWHLGQSLHGFERGYEQQRFLDWLLDCIAAESIDALLIAGDIFDTANPSAAAQKQWYRFLQAARARVPHLAMVAIAGNHDSPGRLEAPSPLLESFETTVVGQAGRNGQGDIDLERLVVPLRDRHGQVYAWCLAIPFLRPGDVPRVETGGDAYLAGVAELYRQALELALSRRRPGQAILALGHCHMAGGTVSQDSERRIVIGGAEMLPAGMFDDRIAYAALGHLHRAQAVGGEPRIRYCGSPLPMSFAETAYPHQVVRIDLDGEQAAAIEPLPVPRFVELLRVPPRPAPLAEVLELLAQLDEAELAEAQRPYLEVRVRLAGPEPGLRATIDAALKDKPVRLARIEPSYVRAEAPDGSGGTATLEDLQRLQPEEVLRNAYRRNYGDEAPGDLLQAFRELLADAGEEAGA